MQKKWLVIVNPVAGNGAFKKNWSLIYNELIAQNFEIEVSIYFISNNFYFLKQCFDGFFFITSFSYDIFKKLIINY